MPVTARSTVSVRTPYPASWTAAASASGEVALASNRTVARSVARLTVASCTPGTAARARSTRPTQAAQVRPSTASVARLAARVGTAVSAGGSWSEGIGEERGDRLLDPF